MAVAELPRPAGDTRIGVHFFPSPEDNTVENLGLFLPQLQAMHCSWLVLRTTPEQNLSPVLLGRLRAANIEPVLWFAPDPLELLDRKAFQRLCRTYAQSGVHYICVYTAPNLARSWPAPAPEHSTVPRRFLEYSLPLYQIIYDIPELLPVLAPFVAPLEPEDWQPTGLLSSCLGMLIDSGHSYLLDKLVVGLHCPAHNRPLTWGKGGGINWPAAGACKGTPGMPPAGSEDSKGLGAWEWCAQAIEQVVGRRLALIVLAGGPTVGDGFDRDFATVDATLHARRCVEIVEMLAGGGLPENVLAHVFWLLVARDNSPYAGARWFRPDGRSLLPKTIGALQQAKPARRSAAPKEARFLQVLMADGTMRAMEMEEYLRGVVPAEMDPRSPLEALKAQAVACRSLARYYREHPQHESAQVCTNAHCQTWRGDFDVNADRAIRETRGVVAVFDREPIPAWYFAHCDGRTRASGEVWVKSLPFAKSVRCVKPFPNVYGHGVGLCQAGAVAMAEQFATAQEILRYFYTGIELEGEIEGPLEARRASIQFSVERRNGARTIAGDLGVPGIEILVTDMWGRSRQTFSGDAPALGEGGFSLALDENGFYEIELLENRLLIQAQDGMNLVSLQAGGRLLSLALPQWIHASAEAAR